MISYDFPTAFGEGSYTMYFSGHGERLTVRLGGLFDDWYLGRVKATGDVGGWRFTVDEPPPPDFPGDGD